MQYTVLIQVGAMIWKQWSLIESYTPEMAK